MIMINLQIKENTKFERIFAGTNWVRAEFCDYLNNKVNQDK